MRKIRYGLMLVLTVLLMATPATAQLSIGIGIGLPNLQIGINLPIYPDLAPIPGYPVYYAPRLEANYFYFDGLYWVFQDDNWYASSWYNGPWGFVEPEVVPAFILRIPVAYYRHRPSSFRGWQSNAPPRWGQHWGNDWEKRRSGWDRWDRRSAPRRAPRPEYQRQYTKDRYPHQSEQQQQIRSRSYRYQPQETVVREHFKQRVETKHIPVPAQQKNTVEPVRMKNSGHTSGAAMHEEQKPKMQDHKQTQDNRHDKKDDDEKRGDRRN